jgi:hypothetical protein
MRVVILVSCLLAVSCSTPAVREQSPEPSAPPPAARSSNEAASEAPPLEKNFEVISYRIEDLPPGLRIIGEVRNRGAVEAGVELEAVMRRADGTGIERLRFWPAELRNIPPGGAEPFTVNVPRAALHGITLQPVAAQIWRTSASGKAFEILSYRVEDHPMGTLLIGQVRNNGATAAGVQLQGVARDGAGTVVDEVQFWPAEERNIPPGGIESFSVSGPRPGTRGFALYPVGAQVWQSASPGQPATSPFVLQT